MSEKATQLHDNRGNSIKVTKIETENKETLLWVVSEQKKKKEEAINQKKTQQFEERLNHLKDGLDKPRRLKSVTAVHEHVGRLKDQFSKVAKHYDITYKEDTNHQYIIDINWTIKPSKTRPKEQYFLRYSKKDLTENKYGTHTTLLVRLKPASVV